MSSTKIIKDKKNNIEMPSKSANSPIRDIPPALKPAHIPANRSANRGGHPTKLASDHALLRSVTASVNGASFHPNYHPGTDYPYPDDYAADYPSNPLVGFNAALKRLEDFVIGSVALIVLMPLMILISIIIKLDSTGPALFCQNRNGRNKEIIKVYKFRTMYQGGTATFKQASKGDPRVTRIGAFLRKTSLDELPQLFNVIQGSMSLVGPRPHPLALDESFKYVIPALSSRYMVKPGITGWAQINGYRGETSKIADMVGRIEHDRVYIKNWSLWMDIKILAMTVFKGWTHENAY